MYLVSSAPKIVCVSLLIILSIDAAENSVDQDQTASTGAVRSLALHCLSTYISTPTKQTTVVVIGALKGLALLKAPRKNASENVVC